MILSGLLIFFSTDPGLFPLFLSSCLFHICLSIPFLLLITLHVLCNNLSQVLWTTFFKIQLQKPLPCQPYLKGSSDDRGSQSSLHSCSLFGKCLAWNTWTRDASCAWLCRFVHMVLPGGLWQVCLLAFSFLKAAFFVPFMFMERNKGKCFIRGFFCCWLFCCFFHQTTLGSFVCNLHSIFRGHNFVS